MNQSVVSVMQQLIGLQQIDTQLFHLRLELSEIPQLKNTLTSNYNFQKLSLQTADDQLKHLQIRQKNLENDIAAKESQINRYKTQQNSVKTNQEYAALTNEISSAEADKSLNEDEVLRIMEQVEAQKKNVAVAKSKVAELEKECQTKIAEFDVRANEMNELIKTLDSQRGQYLPNIRLEILTQYEAILSKRDGVAVVPLEGHSCGGCSISFPPQFINEIRLHEQVKFCESCNRIVYDSEE